MIDVPGVIKTFGTNGNKNINRPDVSIYFIKYESIGRFATSALLVITKNETRYKKRYLEPQYTNAQHSEQWTNLIKASPT